MNTDTAHAQAIEFLKTHKIGVIATVGEAGVPHASFVFYVPDDNTLAVYFCTLTSTRKYADITHNARVAFVVAAENVPQTLQIEGTAKQISEEEKIKLGLSDLVGVLESNSMYVWPVAKMDPAEVVLMRITPEWIRWGDFTTVLQGKHNIFIELI